MKKNKKRKHKNRKRRPSATAKRKLVKRFKHKSRPRKSAKSKALTKKQMGEMLKIEHLVLRGKERGFVTYDEILKEFPTIETNIVFLDGLYEKLHALGIDVLEGGGLLEMPEEETAKHYTYSRGDSSYDSIQMYLREIG